MDRSILVVAGNVPEKWTGNEAGDPEKWTVAFMGGIW